MIFWVSGLSCLSAILYRMGGTSLGTKWRDIGCSGVIVAEIALFGQIKGIVAFISLLPCFFLMWGALSTYRYFLPKPKDYGFIHYFLHGLFVAMAMFPLMFFTGHWLGFGVRCLVCAVGIGIWSVKTKWATLEELGRGFIIAITLPLLLI